MSNCTKCGAPIQGGRECESCFNQQPGIIPPPPTPLATLERMHGLCMELENHIDDIKMMGGLEEHEDELETDIQALTFKVQSIIEEINGENDDDSN